MKWIFCLFLVLFPLHFLEKTPPGAILPVQHEGRVKPLDTVARTAKILLQGKEGSKPSEWLLQTLFEPEKSLSDKVIRNDHPDLFSETYLSLEQIQPRIDELYAKVLHVMEIDPQERDPYQRALMKLWNRIELYMRLIHTVQLYQPIPSLPYFAIVPPENFDVSLQWENRGENLNGWSVFIDAWPDLSGEVESYLTLVQEKNPKLVSSLKLEVFFNVFNPLFISKIYYLIALVIFLLLALFRKKHWVPSSFLLAAFTLHTIGIILRMTIEGRPPVTNLYSSALFVGWGGVLTTFLFSRQDSPLLPVACILGFTTLSVSSALSLSGDTLQMMRAVLDSNFWLSTHVVTITLGYSATFLAGFLAAYTIVFRRDVRTASDQVYRIVSLALLLSFVGTLLGGIWADQSWGRFWGWDPKENGALMTVLWNAIILHVRIGGYAKGIGLLRLAVFGNIVTSFSWFVVNMLGIGLHSYGFIDQAFLWLFAFILLNLAIICIPGNKKSSSGLLFRK